MCKYKTLGYTGLFSLHIEPPSYVFVMLNKQTLVNNKTMTQWNGSLKEGGPEWYHKRFSNSHGMCQKAYNYQFMKVFLPILNKLAQ